MKQNLEGILEKSVGRLIEISIINLVEGRDRRTKGVLLSIDDDLIIMDVEWRDHWYSPRKTRVKYYCNRSAWQLISILVFEKGGKTK